MVIACEIVFDKNPNKVFQSSGYVTGYVRVTPKKEQVVRGIYVKIIGVTTTRWELGRIVRCSKEEFLVHQMSVLNPIERRLSGNTHKFPFQFALPEHLPSSFDGEFGFIHYAVKVLIEIPFQPSKTVEEQITINKLIDIDDSDLQMAVSVCKGFNPYFVFSCLPWFPVKIDAHIKPGVYSIGSTVDVGVNVSNRSFRRIRMFLVQLIKEVNYSSSDQVLKRRSNVVLNETEVRGCKQNQKRTICLGCQIKVPQTTPSDLSGSMIKIRHFIRIIAFMGRSYRPTLLLPINIIILPDFQD